MIFRYPNPAFIILFFLILSLSSAYAGELPDQSDLPVSVDTVSDVSDSSPSSGETDQTGQPDGDQPAAGVEDPSAGSESSELLSCLQIIQGQLWIVLVVGLLYFVYKFFRIFF